MRTFEIKKVKNQEKVLRIFIDYKYNAYTDSIIINKELEPEFTKLILPEIGSITTFGNVNDTTVNIPMETENYAIKIDCVNSLNIYKKSEEVIVKEIKN